MARIPDRSLTRPQPRQPLLGLWGAELAGALVPFARLGEVGLHALHAASGRARAGRRWPPAAARRARGPSARRAGRTGAPRRYCPARSRARRGRSAARRPRGRRARARARARGRGSGGLGGSALVSLAGGGGGGGGWTDEDRSRLRQQRPVLADQAEPDLGAAATPAGTIICRLASAWSGTDHAPGAVT